MNGCDQGAPGRVNDNATRARDTTPGQIEAQEEERELQGHVHMYSRVLYIHTYMLVVGHTVKNCGISARNIHIERMKTRGTGIMESVTGRKD